MRFEAFEEEARAAYESIPDEYKEGVDGLVVSREALPHPERPDVFTLGHCQTEDHISDFGSAETTRSMIVLYWGSFRALARLNPSFDWEGELWETLTHELRHHLESLAREDALEGVDYAMEETFRRDEGVDFDPWYYQQGEQVAPGVYLVEDSVYLEQRWRAADFAAGESLSIEWKGATYEIPRPNELGDLHFVWLRDLDPEVRSIELVLVRSRSWWEDVKRLAGRSRPTVLESEAWPTPRTS